MWAMGFEKHVFIIQRNTWNNDIKKLQGINAYYNSHVKLPARCHIINVFGLATRTQAYNFVFLGPPTKESDFKDHHVLHGFFFM